MNLKRNGNGTDEVVIEPSQGNGYLGQLAWYIPAYLAIEKPALTLHYGLSWENNRKTLAETFHRPFRWIDYCNKVTLNGTMMEAGCHENDTIALRWPLEGSDEERSFFNEDLYTGFFHPTDENNCTMYPSSCTGHFIAGPCRK